MEILNNEVNAMHIEQDYQAYQEAIELGEALKRLQRNEDFIKVFEQHYMIDLPAALAQSYVRVHNDQQRLAVQHDIIGVGALKNYLSNIKAQADNAAANIEYLRELRDGE